MLTAVTLLPRADADCAADRAALSCSRPLATSPASPRTQLDAASAGRSRTASDWLGRNVRQEPAVNNTQMVRGTVDNKDD